MDKFDRFIINVVFPILMVGALYLIGSAIIIAIGAWR